MEDVLLSLEQDTAAAVAIARARELIPEADVPTVLRLTPALLRHHGHADAAVRKAVLLAAEDLAPRAPDVLPECFESILALLSDEDPQVVRRALLTAAALLRPALALIAKSTEDGASSAELLWQRLCELKERLLGQLVPARASATGAQELTAAIKLANAVVLAYSLDGAGDGAGDGAAREEGAAAEGWSLARLSPGHRLLERHKLEQHGAATLKALLGLVAEPPSSEQQPFHQPLH